MGGLKAAKSHANNDNAPWLLKGMGYWGQAYDGPITFAVPVGTHAKDVQQKMNIPNPGRYYNDKGRKIFLEREGQQWEAFCNQSWTTCFFFEHVVIDPSNQIRPVKSYLIPAPGMKIIFY